MYLPTAFAETDVDAIVDCIRAHPLGLLITTGRRDPIADSTVPSPVVANPVPFHLDADADGSLRLVAHVARANPVWRDADPAAEALVVFQGPQAYVSPGWYASKPLHGKVVPTWNYAVVQARGPLVVHDDPAWLHALVRRLTDHHEASMRSPWAVDDAPADFVDQMVSAIVGIEIPVREVVGKFKLSQNRGAADRAGVVQGLADRAAPDATAVATAMRRGNPPG
jgi:transcriptional regulator